MSRPHAALAVALLVAAAVVPATAFTGGAPSAAVEPADTPVVGVSENTTRVLLLTRADAAGFDQPSVAVTTTLAAGQADISASMWLERVERALASADSDAARAAILRNQTDRLEARVTALRDAASQAQAAYERGDLTARQYLLRLALVHERGVALGKVIGDRTGGLIPHAEAGGPTYERLQTLNDLLATVTGPVRDHVSAVVAGQRSSLRVSVVTGDGVMLSAMVDGEYVRETYRPSNLDAGAANDPVSADRIGELYPWSWEHRQGYTVPSIAGIAYQFTLLHSHGRLAAYIDMSTEQPFVEHQWQDLSALPVEVAANATSADTTLSVSRAYSGGPLHVGVTNATGAPVDVPVRVNGTQVGATGEDGGLWTLSPAGDYNVTVTRRGETLRVNVTAAPRPA